MKYFGTDGIRRNSDYFTEQFLNGVCASVVSIKKRPKIVIAKDPRISGDYIEKMMKTAFVKSGARVLSLGMTATPVLAFCTRIFHADFGIMISASHNPPEYNGIKFFDSDGRKIEEETEALIEKRLEEGIETSEQKEGVIERMDGDSFYIKHFSSLLKPLISRKRILLDTANGATAFVAQKLFSELGCDVETIFCDTSGVTINQGCGVTSPQAFIKKMKTGQYDIGFSFDGDGDRVLAYCGGKLLDGDHMVYIIAQYLKERNEWNGKKIIGTIMSNRGVEEAAQKHGFQFIRTRVGDKYVAEEMKKTGAELGGEASGHVIIGKYQNTGDGLLAAVMLTAAECAKDVHFYDDIVDYPQASGDIITTHEKLAEYKANEEAFAEKLEEIRAENGARLVVRPSGTEPKIRIMAEASTINKTYCAIGQARLCILRGMRK